MSDNGQINSTDKDMLDNVLRGAGASLADPEYHVPMDLNRDGQIDATDMAIFRSLLAHWQMPLPFGSLSDPDTPPLYIPLPVRVGCSG